MEIVDMTWRFPNIDAVWRFLTTMAGGVALEIATMSREEQIAVRHEIEAAAEPFKTGMGYAFPGSAQNTLAA